MYKNERRRGKREIMKKTELINDNVVHCMWLLINKDVYP
jgi:hypothetical protein